MLTLQSELPTLRVQQSLGVYLRYQVAQQPLDKLDISLQTKAKLHKGDETLGFDHLVYYKFNIIYKLIQVYSLLVTYKSPDYSIHGSTKCPQFTEKTSLTGIDEKRILYVREPTLEKLR